MSEDLPPGCLQVLWLADNNIVNIEGLDRMSRLRDLNLARNDIVHVGDALSKNMALQVEVYDIHR